MTLTAQRLILLRLNQNVLATMPGSHFQLVEEVLIELFLTNQREEMRRLFGVRLVEPGARADHRLTERSDVMTVIDVLGT